MLPFAIKDAIIIAKAIVTTKKVTVAAKAIAGTTHALGVSGTIAAATTTCIVVGGVVWSIDRIEDLDGCWKAWKSGDMQEFTSRAASLLGKIHFIGNDSIVKSTETLLSDKGYDSMDVVKF